VREAFRIRSDKDTHFTTAIAANGGIEEEDIIFPNRAKKCAVVHAAIQADEALNWELWLASRAMKSHPDMDGDSIVGRIPLDLATNGKRYAAGAQYYYDTALAAPFPVIDDSAAILNMDMESLRAGKLQNFGDESGATDGTISGATDVVGKVGRARYFDGNDYVTIGSFPLTGRALTFAAWVRCQLHATAHQAFMGDNTTSATIGYIICYRPANTDNLAWEFADGATPTSVSSPIFFTGYDDTWVHVAVVCDYAAKTCLFYRNGALLTTAAMSGTPVFPSTDRVRYLGAHSTLPDLPLTNGYIDEPHLFQMALSEADIQRVMNNQNLAAIHMTLVNRSATPKTIGANGEVVVMLTMEPYG
jgi:hypothetical protein